MATSKKVKIGIGVGSGITTIIGLFLVLQFVYGLQIVSINGDIKCAGTLDNPCLSYFNINNPTTNTIEIYNKAGMKLDFAPNISDYALFIKDKRCKADGTCACSLKDGTKIGYTGWKCVNLEGTNLSNAPILKFSKYSQTSFLLYGLKNNPTDTIKWGFGFSNNYLDPVWRSIENITIEKEYPDLKIEGKEVKYYDNKFSRFGDWIVTSVNEYSSSWFPDNHPLKDYKNLTIELQAFNNKTGMNVSVIGVGLVPKYFGGNFNWNFSNPSGFIEASNILNNTSFEWHYSTTESVYYINKTLVSNETDINILKIPKKSFSNYIKINNMNTFKKGLSDKLFLDPTVSACGTMSTADSLYTLDRSISGTGSCMTVGANGVILDCVGFTITWNTNGDLNMYAIINDGYYNNTIIQGCNIVNGSFSASATYSPAIRFASLTHNSTFFNNTIKTGSAGGASGISMQFGSRNAMINNNTITTDGRAGTTGGDTGITNLNVVTENLTIKDNTIYTYGGGANAYGIQATGNNMLITNNKIYTYGAGTGNTGLSLGNKVNWTTISYNTIYTNGQSSDNVGIAIVNGGHYNNISHNRVYTNGTTGNHGINLQGLATVNNYVRYNNFLNNTFELNSTGLTYGMKVYGFTNNNTFTNNSFTFNGVSSDIFIGIDIVTNRTNMPSGNNFTGNKIINNIGMDLYMVNTTMDDHWFIDQEIKNYTIRGVGDKINFGNSTYGTIEFLTNVSGNGLNLIGNSTSDIFIDNLTANVARLNGTMKISFYNVNLLEPVIITRNGVICNYCANFTSLSSGTASFNTTGDGNYTLVGNYSAPVATECNYTDAIISIWAYTGGKWVMGQGEGDITATPINNSFGVGIWTYSGKLGRWIDGYGSNPAWTGSEVVNNCNITDIAISMWKHPNRYITGIGSTSAVITPVNSTIGEAIWKTLNGRRWIHGTSS